MWPEEPTDDRCDAPDGWEPLPPCPIGAPTQDDVDFAALLAELDDGPWRALDAAPCPVCMGPRPARAASCGDADCMVYAGAVALVRLDEPFGFEPMVAE